MALGELSELFMVVLLIPLLGIVSFMLALIIGKA